MPGSGCRQCDTSAGFNVERAVCFDEYVVDDWSGRVEVSMLTDTRVQLVWKDCFECSCNVSDEFVI